jgi:hypothetical protein
MSYESVLIREATDDFGKWCSDCQRIAEDCVCEEICDHFRSEDVGVFNSGADVRVFPAAPEYPLQLTYPKVEPVVGTGGNTPVAPTPTPFNATVGSNPTDLDLDRGLEAEPYTYEEADARRNERIGDRWQNDPHNYAI